MCWIVVALLLATVIGRVFVQAGTLASVEGRLVAMLGLVLARRAFVWGGEAVGQRAADALKTDLRQRLAAKLVALGPTYTRGERFAHGKTLVVISHRPAALGLADRIVTLGSAHRS
jgi:ABC-type transport system involved in cytochrome bd biosynthesis fused ATPase/permease subunit